MNKILISLLCIIILFGGIYIGTALVPVQIKYIENAKNQEIEENTVELIHNMCIIFDRHNIYDSDGSDEMSELLKAQDNLAEIYNW